MLKSVVIPFLAVTCAELVNGGSVFVERTSLVRRQLEPSNIPSECDTICGPFFADMQRCGSLNTACLCTEAVANDGVNCANCVASVYPSELANLQSAVDESVQSCAQHGTPINPVKLTGISPSGATPASATVLGGSATPVTTTSASGASGGSTKSGDGVRFSLSFPTLAMTLGVSAALAFYV